MDLSVIIINWNSKAYLRECVLSIYQHTDRIAFEIIVLDNASYDGCGEILKTEFPQVRFFQNDENLGFAKGNNLAVKQAKGKVLVFLNPDTVLKNNALNQLYDALTGSRHLGAMGVRLLNADGTIQTSCVQSFPTLLNHVLDSAFLRNISPGSTLWGISALYQKSPAMTTVDSVSGACLAATRSAFVKVGGFSDDFFMYYEDTDFCLKLRKAGFRNCYLPSAMIVHYGGKSSGGGQSKFSAVVMAESAWRFFYKHRGGAYAVAFRLLMTISALFRIAVCALAYAFSASSNSNKRVSGSIKKWWYVICWTLGFEKSMTGTYKPSSIQ